MPKSKPRGRENRLKRRGWDGGAAGPPHPKSLGIAWSWRSQTHFQHDFSHGRSGGSPGRSLNARSLTRHPQLIARSGCRNEDSVCAGFAGERPLFGAGHNQFEPAAALGSSIKTSLAFLIKPRAVSPRGWERGAGRTGSGAKPGHQLQHWDGDAIAGASQGARAHQRFAELV